ncbi:LIM and SH3 domain protein F42H10.3 isoform X2 [Cimex lectularius]|uniref:Nebulin repeat protein n=1 Tax=Cimex lectularius TaxID=79782 RepID=A0A8I6RKI2_CIMLE|nr:LIM and SH3 domain protein F42H10.3 isoform X2 [Cimex lectularius]
MNKKCARCEKTVYPIEELKCLDKIWHKQCFKCQVCNMTLNMRNYKGFNKDPYCEAHIPKAKATTVADTPEMKRIAENTKLQSNVKYHAEFEKTKGKLTQVADDPETLRIKQNSRIISNVAYHGDLEKKAAMEQKRNINGEPVDTGPSGDAENMNLKQHQEYNVRPPTHHHQQPVNRDYIHAEMNNKVQNSPYSARQTSTVIYTSERGPVNSPVGRQIGSIADLDPVNNYYGSLSSHNTNHQVVQHQQQPQQQPPPHRASGRVYRAMYDYEAQDRDEVSFIDGDIIVDCTAVDAGWMTGLVQRTGQMGMLPANYVEPAI